MTPLCVGCEPGLGCALANAGMALALFLMGAITALACVGLAMLAGDKNGGG